MKWLTLNIHSWMEEQTEEKLDILANFILSNDLDGISLQEVNQRIDATVEEQPFQYIPSSNETMIIKRDNYALCLVKRLAELGASYYWSWTFSHIGYDVFEEGVAILSKTPMTSQAVLVSSVNDTSDIRRRMMLCSKVIINNQKVLVTSNHYSWWRDDAQEGFQLEWRLSSQVFNQEPGLKLVFGDFNGPDTRRNETYDLVTESFFDTFKLSKQSNGYNTIPEKIDGWEHSSEQLRVDYAFASDKLSVKMHEVVFDGKTYPSVSDHYGVVVSIDL